MKSDHRYVLPSAGINHKVSRTGAWTLLAFAALLAAFTIGFVLGTRDGVPEIPRCQFAPDIIIGSGEYNRDIGYWSDYDCVSALAFGDHNYVNRKSEVQP